MTNRLQCQRFYKATEQHQLCRRLVLTRRASIKMTVRLFTLNPMTQLRKRRKSLWRRQLRSRRAYAKRTGLIRI
nr:MAG TPA: hypothetical protein [Caudoviricetes sp.]